MKNLLDKNGYTEAVIRYALKNKPVVEEILARLRGDEQPIDEIRESSEFIVDIDPAMQRLIEALLRRIESLHERVKELERRCEQ